MNFKKIITNRIGVMCIAIFCSILWGTAYPVLKISFAELNFSTENIMEKIVFAGMRFALAAILILAFYKIILKGEIYLPKANIIPLMVLGFFNTFLQYALFYNGLANTTGIKGAILASVGNFFIVILAHFIYKNDRINYQKILGLIMGFAGIFIANWGKELVWTFKLEGEGFLIITGIAIAIGTVISKNLAQKMHPFLMTGWQMLFGALLLLLIGIKDFIPVILKLNTLTVCLLIYASFLSATAFSLWNAILKYNKAGEITLYRFMIPVSGAFLSAIFIAEEKFTWQILIGLALVSSGIILINLYKNKKIPNKTVV